MVNFINILLESFFVQKCFAQFFSTCILAEKALSYKKCAHKYAPTSLFVLGAPHSFRLFDEIEIFVDIFIRFVEFDVVIVDIVDRLRCVAKRHSASQKIKGDKFWVDFSNILGPTAKLIMFTLKNH